MRLIGIHVVFLLAALLSGCGNSDMTERSPDNARQTVDKRTIEDVLAAHTQEWMGIAGVVGVGISEWEGKPCINVLVAQKSDSLTKRIPKEVEGYPVRLEVTGEIKAR